ncbi:MAG TPA: type IV pilus assembly protein PilM [Limnochordia bacterium]|nr:type IV pilus assembly protein PilM [Limnochordia bacterium]HPZ31784.1 type IV pilus assembly protein PilM [Limnochordia bacterium]HQD71595.1 type IV pilus assembly protein PilM [Limnochordia bacterium]
MAKSCLGLDIGSFSIKIAALERQGKHSCRVNALLQLSPPPGCLKHDRLLDPEALAMTLRTILDEHRIKTDRVALGLNSHNIMIRQISLPRMSGRELAQAIELDLAEILKLPPNHTVDSIYYSFDAQYRGSELDVVVAGCARGIVDPFISMMKQAELTPVVIDVAAFNLPRIDVSSAEKRICYVDLGHEQTVIYVESHGFYSVYRILPVGGRILDEAVAAALEIDTAEAANLKREYSLEDILGKATGAKSMLRSVIRQYTGGIIQTLDYLRSQSRASRISDVLDQVALCGGVAHVPDLDTIFQQELDVAVRRLNPFESHQLIKGNRQPPDYGVYANAVGLALRGLNE